MNQKNLESAHMKAMARMNRYKEKNNSQDVDEYKKAFIQMLMKNPAMLQYAMQNDPEAMSRLMKRYGLGGQNANS